MNTSFEESVDPERETIASLVLSEFLQSKPPASTIKILAQLIRNASSSGKEEPKYQTIRLSNSVIQTKVVAVPGAQNVLAIAGFEPKTDDAQTWVFSPTAASMTDSLAINGFPSLQSSPRSSY